MWLNIIINFGVSQLLIFFVWLIFGVCMLLDRIDFKKNY